MYNQMIDIELKNMKIYVFKINKLYQLDIFIAIKIRINKNNLKIN